MVSILGANSVSGGYEVSNSLRFNDDDSPYLTFTPSSAGDRDVWTWSAWIKTSGVGTLPLFTAGAGAGGGWSSGGTGTGLVLINGTFYTYWNSPSTPTTTTAVFRDPSAWYHVVLQANDTTLKVYVNSVEHSSKSISGDGEINNTNAQSIGTFSNNFDSEFDGYMTEIHFIDGTAKAPTDFGEFDDNEVWIPKKYTGTYGTNGFFLEFKQTGTSANSSGIGADTSGNDNHFTPNNLAATDITEDTCTNNFATLNSALADGQFNTSELSEGNTFYNEGQGNNGDGQPTGTFAFNSGKWYWEVQVPSEQNNRAIGFCRMDRVGIDQPPQLHGTGFTATNSVVGINLQDDTIDQVDNAGTHTQHASGLTGMSNNDIFGVAVNLDDGNFQFYRNGSTYGSSYSLSNLSEWQEHGAVPCASGKTYMAYRFNFGNPAFSISSGNSDGKYGNFEYAPPSGYYALCTKRLAEFG